MILFRTYFDIGALDFLETSKLRVESWPKTSQKRAQKAVREFPKIKGPDIDPR